MPRTEQPWRCPRAGRVGDGAGTRSGQIKGRQEIADPACWKDNEKQETNVALLVIRGGERVMSPGQRRARRGGLCLDSERCARTGRKRGRAAASPARCRGAAAATSAVATTPLPWC